MTVDHLQQYWALLAASVLGLAIALFIVFRSFEDSARGKLTRLLRSYDSKVLAANKARKTAERSANKLRRLQAKKGSAIPRELQEASDALGDAEALLKIAADQVLIAANLVRKTIVEEFPINQHEKMRHKYLQDEEPSDKPFTF